MFHEPVNLRDFRGTRTMKDALGRLYEQLAARKIELAILVDGEAFKKSFRRLDVYGLPVQLPSAPRQVTVGTLLRLLLDQVPGGDATFLYRDLSFLEITTGRELARERESARSR